MTIEKLPSGSYRISQMDNGKRYRITIDHKPTNAEATRLMAEAFQKSTPSQNSTFETAAGAYIESRLNVISPSTERGYRGIVRNMPEWFKARYIKQINRQDVQRLVNECAKDHSPKTVRNLSGFVASVLNYYGCRMDPPTLPQKEAKKAYIPTEEDVKRIAELSKGTHYEIPLALAAMGLRKSEICALTLDDLEGTTLHINKAMVRGTDGWIVKGTKTTESTRDIVIAPSLADKIREQGFIYIGYPNQILKALTRFQSTLGIPHFSLHKMRHFCASYLHQLGFSEAQIQEWGGWKTDHVMKSVYRHAMQMDEAKAEAAKKMGELFAHDLPTEN